MRFFSTLGSFGAFRSHEATFLLETREKIVPRYDIESNIADCVPIQSVTAIKKTETSVQDSVSSDDPSSEKFLARLWHEKGGQTQRSVM